MNIHQMGEMLFGALAGGTAYNFELERYGSTVKTELKMRISPADGAIVDAGEVRMIEHDRSGFITVDAFDGLSPAEPIVGDVFIDVDHGNRRWVVVPNESDSAWSWHGTDETNYLVLLKEH